MVWPLKIRNLVLLVSLLFSFQVFAFDKGRILIGKKKIKVEVAKTFKDRNQGMMMRTSWGQIEGMLFVFKEEKPRSFWMKNTFLPLSIGFFDKNKVLLEIYDLKPSKSMTQKTVDSVSSKKPATYVLEVPKGWFQKNSVDVGQGFKFID